MRLKDALPKKGSKKSKRRLGRGIASGQGASSGKGMRGQKARSGGSTRPGFEGGQNPLYKRLPKLKGFTSIVRPQYTIVNVNKLALLPANTEVTLISLIKIGIVKTTKRPLKILGDGKLNVPLKVQAAAFSKTARDKITAVGGICIEEKKSPSWSLDFYDARKREQEMIQNYKEELDSFRNLPAKKALDGSPQDWDSFIEEPPNDDAITWGKTVIEVLLKMKFLPTCVAPSSDGGVAICFLLNDKYADIECFNTGEILAVTSDKSNQDDSNPDVWYDHTEVWEVKPSIGNIGLSLEKIRHFLAY